MAQDGAEKNTEAEGGPGVNRKYKVIFVAWEDSWSQPFWLNEDEIEARSLRCISVGFLVEKNKDVIVIATSSSDAENAKPWADVTIIPRKTIKQMEILKEIICPMAGIGPAKALK